MTIEQIYTGCLAQGAYFIESDGEAAVIDPLRETAPYLDRALKTKTTIKYVFETHFHADFVSGHVDLGHKTGATVVYGPGANPSFEAHIAADGEIFKIGKMTIQAIHTPGHTLESTCYLLLDESGVPKALFSGDTLFIGDVGRPDLAQKAADMTQEQLAGILFDSLRTKIMPLPDDVIVYPAHGAGSACGKSMSKETFDLLGHQKSVNYALRENMTRDEFIREVTDGLEPPPAYFPLNVSLNKHGYDNIDDVIKRGLNPLSPLEFETAANETNALILDTRDAASFSRGFIPNSIFIGIDGTFAPWVGALVPDVRQELLIVADPGREEEVVRRLARVGYDYCIGYLKGGIAAWKEADLEIDTLESIDPDELAALMSEQPETQIIDVRKPGEYKSEHIEGAVSAPLDFINDSMALVGKDKTAYVHCGSGYRSVIFASILRARGYDNLIDVRTGMKGIKDSGKFLLVNNVCSSSSI
jgi:glyoxylase-like metal-dependent hydrolase (beta-lactamase superfamily II)/rhodanese-related sulfurtransferase